MLPTERMSINVPAVRLRSLIAPTVRSKIDVPALRSVSVMPPPLRTKIDVSESIVDPVSAPTDAAANLPAETGPLMVIDPPDATIGALRISSALTSPFTSWASTYSDGLANKARPPMSSAPNVMLPPASEIRSPAALISPAMRAPSVTMPTVPALSILPTLIDVWDTIPTDTSPAVGGWALTSPLEMSPSTIAPSASALTISPDVMSPPSIVPPALNLILPAAIALPSPIEVPAVRWIALLSMVLSLSPATRLPRVMPVPAST